MNHLMVGLGGTGGKIIAATRRLIFQQFREVEPAELALDYLYLDTSKQDTDVANITAPLKPGDETWRTLGHSVQLSPAQIVHMKQGNFAHIISNPEDYPTFRPWLGDIALWKRIWNSAPNGIEAGGQLRRFGRYLLAQNLSEVRKALIDRLGARQAGGMADAQWTIHVVAGLAGGTGSGTLIDVLGQIRTIAAGARAKVIAYVVLPETEDTTWAKENYYANGFAALAELNGFIVKRFAPANVGKPTETYASEIPVNNTFVITNHNENGLIVDVDKVLPNIVAETLFQIIVASGDARALGAAGGGVAGNDERTWRDMVTGENYFGGYEKDSAEGADERANRFLSFGVKRIAIPHQEVREYSAMVFVRQFLLQSLNNQWVEGQGFSQSRKSFDGAAVARLDSNRQKWLLTTQHLMLEVGSLENDRKDWRSLQDEFRTAFNGKTKSIIDTVGNNDVWPRELETFAQEYFERGFRREGVADSYRVAERSITDRARLIVRDRVAADLFKSWLSGIWSLRDIVRIVDELIADVSERIAGSDTKIQRHGTTENERETQRKKQTAEYLSYGRLSPDRLIHPRDQRLQQISATLADLYAERAAKTATAYMQKTLQAVLSQLQDLKTETETVSNRFDLALEIVETRRAQRVKIDGAMPAQSHQYQLYDPEHVRELLKRMEQTEALQRSQVSNLRDKLVEQLGANPGFATFAELNEARIVEMIESDAEQRAELALSQMESERDRILEISVIQKLYEEYSGRDEELRRFITERVREAGTFAAFSPQQIAIGGANVEKSLVAFVPAAEELKEHLRAFHTKLIGYIQGAGNGARVPIVSTRDRSHEIVFLSLVNQFPLRYLSALDFLKVRYERLVDGADEKRKRLELHIEGDGNALPSLFTIGIQDLRKRLRAHWLIAETAGKLIERKNPRTGQTETIIKAVGSDGEIRTPVVGGALADCTKTIDHAGGGELRRAVEDYVKSLVHVDERKALIDQFIARKNAALEAAQFDETDPKYIVVRDDVAGARALLES